MSRTRRKPLKGDWPPDFKKKMERGFISVSKPNFSKNGRKLWQDDEVWGEGGKRERKRKIHSFNRRNDKSIIRKALNDND